MSGNGEQEGRLLTFPDDTEEILRAIREEDVPDLLAEAGAVADETGAVVNEIRQLQSSVQTQTAILQAIADAGEIELGDDVAATTEEFTIGFGIAVPPNTTPFDPEIEEREIQTDGRINGIVISFPSGTQQAAGVQLRRSSGEKLFPRNPENDFIGFDDKTQEFDVNVPVSEGEIIEIAYANTDPEEAHFVNGGFFNVEVA